MKSKLSLIIAAALLSGQALAHEPGTWVGRAGITNVDPKSDNSDIVEVDSGAALNLNAVYFFNENWALDILAATPFNHDIELLDGTKVGETDHLPPTVSIQYHFPSGGTFYPYVGLGVNYTIFFSEETTGPLEGTDLVLDDSFGLAAQIGVDWRLNEKWFLNLDARWIDIDSDAEVRGADLAFEVEIDPVVYGLSLGYQF